MAFTYKEYRRLLEILIETDGYSFVSFPEALKADSQFVILRHDVDVCLKRATLMAEIEHDMGVKATYFFLVSSPCYPGRRDESRRQLFHWHWCNDQGWGDFVFRGVYRDGGGGGKGRENQCPYGWQPRKRVMRKGGYIKSKHNQG